MAMGPAKGQEATRQVEMVCLDGLVPEDDLYRRIDGLVDWGFARSGAASYYADALGRPSVDPIVLLKLMLAGALEGIGSMRELLRRAERDLAIRRFLGYGLGERLPAHQTVSEAHSCRFVDARVFEQAFQRTVALCAEHDLLDGTHLSADAFHAEADAALKSLRASLALAPAGAPADSACDEEPPAPPAPVLSLAEPRSGPTPKRRSSNLTAVSRTDPDAKLRGKPGQRPHLVHRGQVAVDPKARCVVACRGEQADGYEGDGLAPLLDRARFHCSELASVGADQGYAAQGVYQDARGRGLVAYIPPQRTMLPPAGSAPRTQAEEEAHAARERCKSETGILAHKRRMADSEGVIAELKNLHGLDRVRCRGTPLFHVQLLLGCSAINLKRLAKHAPQTASGVAAAPAAAAKDTDANAAASANHRTPSASASIRLWKVAISLN
ncbi:MAG: transposase [Myxococcota bacterium]